MKSRSKYRGELFPGQSVRIRQSNGNFMQAQRKSQERYSTVKKFGGIIRDDVTVATASRDSLTWFRNERKSLRATQTTIDAHILPAFEGG